MKIQYDKNKLDRCVSNIEEEKTSDVKKGQDSDQRVLAHAGLGLCI